MSDEDLVQLVRQQLAPPVDDGDLIDMVRSRRQESLTATMDQVQREGLTDPVRAAEVTLLADRYQVPTSAALRKLDDLRNLQSLDDMRAADLPRSAPVTAEFLADPSNAAVAGTEWSLMQSLERGYRAMVTDEEDVSGVIARGNAATTRLRSTREGYESPSYVTRLPDEKPLGEHVVRALGQVGPSLSVASGGVLQATVVDPLEALAQPLVENGVLPTNPFTPIKQALQRSRASAQGVAGAIRGDQSGLGFVEKAIVGGVESLATQLPMIGASMLTRNPSTALTGMTGTSFGTAYGQAVDQGVEQGNALAFATVQSLIDLYTEKNPLTTLLDDLSAGTGLAKTFLKNQLGEQTGEAVATTLQDANEWLVLPENEGKTLDDYMAARPDAFANTAIATLVSSAGTVAGAATIGAAAKALTTPTIDYAQESKNLLRAMEISAVEQNQLDQMIDLATNSKVREADPERFKTFLQSATGGRTVYVAQEEVAKAAQNGLSFPPEVLKQLDGSGADVAITLRDVLGNPEIAAQLRDSIRIRPGGLTKAELSTEGKSQIDEILRTAASQLDREDEIDQLVTRIAQEYAATGAVNEKDASTSAELQRSYLRTILANPRYADLTPAELADMVGLRVTGPATPAVATAPADTARVMEQDAALAGVDLTNPETVADAQREWAVNRTESPYFKRWFGDSKVVDAEGRPLVVYHGTTQSFDNFRPNEALGGGIFFSPDPQEAAAFTAARGGNVIPAYLNASKVWPEVVRSYDEVATIEEAKAEGYDAIQVSDSATGVVNWVVFNPNQIKSAVGNQGTFNPESASILNQAPIDATGITLTEEVQIAETGETVTVEQDAQRLYDQSVKRLEMLKRVQECLARG